MLFCINRIAAGAVLGVLLSAGLGYLWLCWGASPDTDGLVSI